MVLDESITAYQLLILLGIPTVVSTFCTFLVHHISRVIRNKSGKKEATDEILIGLAKGELTRRYDRIAEKGEMDSDEYREWVNMYNAYHSMGGNGTMTKLKNQLDAIDIVNS